MIDNSLKLKLEEVDSFYKLEQVRVFDVRNVQQECDANSFQPRILVLATHGIFLYKEKTNSQLKVVKSISHSELLSIQIAGETASFSSNVEQIKVKDKDIASFALLTYCIRQAQFSLLCLPLTIHFPPEYASQLQSPSPYSDNVFGDRIITCAYLLRIELTKEELTSILNSIFIEDQRFVFKDDEINDKYMDIIIHALAYECDLREIRLKNMTLCTFFSFCSSLFMYNQFVERIYLDSCNYNNCISSLRKLLKSKHLFSPKEWIFQNQCCDDQFFSLFSEIPNISNEITKLEFSSCKFTDKIMEDLLQEILFNDCYHSLREIKFSHINKINGFGEQMCSLLSSNWVSSNESLKVVELTDCGLDSSTALIKIMGFETVIDVLRFRYSNAELLIDLRDKAKLEQLIFLDFRHTLFSSQNFISLFQIVKSSFIYIRGFDLSYLSLFPPILKDVLEAMGNDLTALPCLQTLFFDGNRMNKKELHFFTKFITLQKNLKHVSVNYSISAKESSLSIFEFMEAICNLEGLQSFSMRSDGSVDLTCGPIIIPYLKRFAKKKLINLDLTNQGFDPKGIMALGEILKSGSIKSFYFDGILPRSPKELLHFCEKVIEAKVDFAHWPYKSFYRFENPMSLVKYPQVPEDQIEDLKMQYLYTFGKKSIDIDEDEDELSMERSNWIIKETKDRYIDPAQKQTENATNAPLPNIKIQGIEYLTQIDPNITELFDECIGKATVEQPLVRVLAFTAEKYSTKQIMKSMMNVSFG